MWHESPTYSGTIFFKTIITKGVFHNIIQQFIVLLRKDERDAVFQQDNAQQHVGKDAMSFLTEFFGERICKWPPRSSDLSLWDFFYAVFFRMLCIMMLLEVLQCSRKKLSSQLGALFLKGYFAPLPKTKKLWYCATSAPKNCTCTVVFGEV